MIVMKSQTQPALVEDPTPTPRDVEVMAEVLEGRHGIYAAAIADFFSSLHDTKGDVSRSWAWAGVANRVRQREVTRATLADTH
jgi:hypothetical protein